MQKCFLGASIAALALAAMPLAAATLPSTVAGHPNLSGLWQSMGTSDWDIQAHGAEAGPLVGQMGVLGAEPPGVGIVEGEEIPYLPAGLEQKNKNHADRWKQDPVIKCYMPGIPRANYMPYPFQIVQTNKDILFVYEYATSNRLINMGKAEEAPSDTWMGTNNGRWEGDTLVIDVTGLNGLAWFDRAGNFGSDKLHIVERWSLTDHDHLNYQATIEDPSVYTHAWKIGMPLYRRVEKDAQLLEFKCVEFAEQLLYGKYTKQGAGGGK